MNVYSAVECAVVWTIGHRSRVVKQCATPERARRLAKLLNDMRPK